MAIAATTIAEIELFLYQRPLSLRSLRSLESGCHVIAELFFFSAFGLFPFIQTADPLLPRKIFVITYFARSKAFTTLRNVSELQSDAQELLRNTFEISSSCLIYSFRERNNSQEEIIIISGRNKDEMIIISGLPRV